MAQILQTLKKGKLFEIKGKGKKDVRCDDGASLREGFS